MEYSEFLSSLNEAQLAAVTYNNGPLLVVAGAGAGKTRVLTYKIAYLLKQGYEPWSILALTFTNKAATEMTNRISAICQDVSASGLWSGTFHSMFARILRMEHEATGYPANYTIYDSTDSKSLMKSIIKEMGLDDKVYKPNVIAGRISEAKNHLILPAQYLTDGSIIRRDKADSLGETGRIYDTYQKRLKAAAVMDFDDLLVNTYYLFKNNEDIRQRYMKRFRYILVDEYQDTNMVQHRILSLLTTPTSSICVVGDDAQSIYGFRGADITNILNFVEQYPSAHTVKLECNYRSTENIVEAANSIIRHNVGQIPKKVYSAGEKGEPLHLFSADTDKEEAQKIIMRITALHNRQEQEYNDIAILYRTNAQSRVLEEALMARDIPYRIYGGKSFYQRKEVKDVLAYLRLAVNPHDEESFRRIINYPARGIGATTLSRLQEAAAVSGVSLWDVTSDPSAYGLNLQRGALAKVCQFALLIKDFQDEAERASASQVAATIIRKTGIMVDLAQEHTAESESRMENIDQLVGGITSYEEEMQKNEGVKCVSLSDYLSNVSLLTDIEEKEDGTPRVSLMTIHAAKGLEFRTVFVTGMEEDLFPNANARLFPREMEEERRLFYVAVTRAKSLCYLSYAHTRFRYGSLQFNERSSFLDEIDKKYIQAENSLQTPSPEPRPRPAQNVRSNTFTQHRSLKRVFPTTPASSSGQKTVKSVSVNGLSIGMRVRHERFGEGVIMGIEGEGSCEKMKIKFDLCGEKNLFTKFARIEKIG